MVEFNNSYSLGQEYVNNYVRNIEELRKTIENSLLYIVSYFVERGESEDSIVIPAGILANNKSYLQELGKKYFKRNFDFRVDKNDTLAVYSVLSNLIHHSKKLCQYDYCELVDFMTDKPEYFTDVSIPLKIISNTDSNIKEYYKMIPASMQKGLQKSVRIVDSHKPSTIDRVVQNKFISPVHLYADVLSNIKKGIDFESLKLYDYLCEQDKPQICSNKLLAIFEELKYLCEQEYTKTLLRTVVSSVNDISDLTREEVFIDELASNIHRGMDTKKLLSLDLQKFLNHPEGKDLSDGLDNGFYPELRALIYTCLK